MAMTTLHCTACGSLFEGSDQSVGKPHQQADIIPSDCHGVVELDGDRFPRALGLREFFRRGNPARYLPVDVTVREAEAVRRRIRDMGFIPGDVVAETIANELDYVRSELRLGRTP